MSRRGPESYGLVTEVPLAASGRRPSRSESLAKLMPPIPFAQGGSYFSSSAPWQQRLAYTVTVFLFVLTVCVVFLCDWLTPACDEDAARAIRPKHDVPFSNAHFVPGCSAVRYGVLLFLTPRECDLGRRIVFAIGCGGVVGYERRRVDRPAGIRTMALVALGSCVFTITSIFAFEDGPMTWDSSRVAAAIPSGVGFLGAGLIWKMKVRSPTDPDGPEHEQIHGLTTAASTWVAASVGIASGGALYFVAAFSVLTLLFVLRFGPRTALSSGHASDSNLDRLGRDLELGETKVDPRPNSTPRRPAAQPREAPPRPPSARREAATDAGPVYHP